ncbi:hypothetical protein [Deinococcus aestuarii]|uniref:hypothetical protein n=1 Tax=Deinococcus aestuarii TaxID=2774531 RepID=UPI001C0B720A|nr:hypothetical protein [Deinococcus aestuarii]
MSYVVMVTRPAETPQSPRHRFRMTDEHGQPRTFAGRAEAERAMTEHLARFPADEATVVPAGEAGAR